MVIFSTRVVECFSPKPRAVSPSSAPANSTKASTASPSSPMPVASPSAMARNSTPISRAVPGAERNRTRLNAPATATPVPILPLTSMITSCTTAGSSASVTAKLELVFC